MGKSVKSIVGNRLGQEYSGGDIGLIEIPVGTDEFPIKLADVRMPAGHIGNSVGDGKSLSLIVGRVKPFDVKIAFGSGVVKSARGGLLGGSIFVNGAGFIG